MKTNILTFLLLFYGSIKIHAAVHLVNNNAGGPGQFTDIQPAISAASVNDTIYVSGSPNIYGSPTIDKSLTLIGAGSYTQKDMQFNTVVQRINIAQGISNVKIIGFYFTTGSVNNIFIDANVSYVSISECLFAGVNCCGNPTIYFSTNCNNISIVNNVFKGDRIFGNTGPSNYAVFLRNNLVLIIGASLADLAIPNAVIEHNTFVSGFQSVSVFSGSSNAVVSSNIFYNLDPTNNCSGCIFNYNITYNTTGPAFNLLGTTNFDNTDPQFVNVNTGMWFLNNNYNVSPTGPAHNAAGDGTDIGYYGGVANVNPYGEPFNVPVIRKMDIQNPSVPQSGNVNVKVRSTVPRAD